MFFKVFKMETNIINVGNSKGIIIPAKLLKIFGFENTVNIEIQGDSLVISSSKNSRLGWEDLIKKEIDANGHSKSLLPDFFEDEKDEWTW